MNAEIEITQQELISGVSNASNLLKTLSHKDRLLILCELKTGEKSVGQLAELLNLQQSPLLQHLARMRREGLVTTRRQSQSIFYSLSSDNASKLVDLLYDLFCKTKTLTDVS